MMLYRALGENVYQFGPAAGSSPGIQFETTVNVLGLSGLRNAYRSVLSADGSSEIRGASRWLEAEPESGARRPTNSPSTVAPAAARRTSASLRMMVAAPFSTAFDSRFRGGRRPAPIRALGETGSDRRRTPPVRAADLWRGLRGSGGVPPGP